jgi:hypothetical protein
MTTSSMIEQFDEVLAAEQLIDARSAFGDPEFCDEVPLYSRYEQIDFLKHEGNPDQALLELALSYLERLRQEVQFGDDGWAAITVSRDAAEDPIVPAVFLCSRLAAQRLATLRLVSPPTTDFGRQMRALLRQARADWNSFSVFEDTQTVAGEVRIFISLRQPPFPVLHWKPKPA